ncbi:uncharacterized protein [Nicotiana sylvestris]|uniref:uncharacterized protein n=1 Tax=Nicotiana sylvestris TaxID=4096 RepID=UPI00388C8ADA
MFFYLTTLSFIEEDVSVLPDKTLHNGHFLVTEAWKHSDFLCKNYILCGLEDDLYNVYSNMKASKKLWIALEEKYKTEDAGLKKFVTVKFLAYKILDSKYVNTQVQELQVIIHDLLAEGSKRKTKLLKKKGCGYSIIMGANIVEDAPENNKKRNKPSGPKSNPSKKRFKGNCYNRGKVGHKSADCRAPRKDEKKDQANMVEKHEDIDDLCAIFSECNLVKNPKEW